jgi:Hydrazine synthase alpha subunit middle domain
MRLRAVSIVSLTLAIAGIFAVVRAEAPKHLSEPALIYTVTPTYDALAWLQGGERFPQGSKLMLHSGQSSRAFVPDFFASADANISFDGTHVLFAGKKTTADHWQIWEMALPKRELKQITSCSEDCVRPFYLPNERIVYAAKIDSRFQLEGVPLDGSKPLQFTYAPGNALPTDILHDGRILFEAAYPLGEGATAELYTVYPDGSGIESYRCDHGDSRHSGRQVSSGDVIFVSQSGLGRFTSPSPHELPIAAPKGEFAGDILQASENEWIVTWRADSHQHYSVRQWNRAANSFSPLVSETRADAVEPQLVAARPIPKRFPSALHTWTGANVLCLNTYTSKLKIPIGTVESVNLYTEHDGKPVLLGRSHVEADGSFFLHVPSERPLQIELLDKSGNTVQREHSWFWMRQGEQRVCVGCHAGPERAPENAVPQVLVKSTEPADMTGSAINSTGGR